MNLTRTLTCAGLLAVALTTAGVAPAIAAERPVSTPVQAVAANSNTASWSDGWDDDWEDDEETGPAVPTDLHVEVNDKGFLLSGSVPLGSDAVSFGNGSSFLTYGKPVTVNGKFSVQFSPVVRGLTLRVASFDGTTYSELIPVKMPRPAID